MRGLRHWLYGLLAAFIGGGAASVSAGLAAIGITPEQYNLAGGLRHTLSLMGVTFLVSGLVSASAFLKQSPLPREAWTEEERKEKLNGGTT